MIARFYNSYMPKAAPEILTTANLERIYAEIEARVERKFEDRIRRLEAELERTKRDRDLWLKRYFREKETNERLQHQLEMAKAENKVLLAKIEKLEARIAELEKERYGRKNEASKDGLPLSDPPEPKKSRGRQVGAKGHGRKSRASLPAVECVHEIPAEDKCCGSCGAPYADMGEQTSEEIDIEYKLIRLVHKRKKAVRTCKCTHSPLTKIAPAPPKLVKGGMLTTDFWAYALAEKYEFQRPIHKQIQLWKAHGLTMSQGTITQGLKRLQDMQIFAGIVEAIKTRIRSGDRQKSDETSWKVFQAMEGKKGYQCWLWSTLGPDACLFRIDPTRSRAVAKAMIGEHTTALVSDRYRVYYNLGENVINCWCWAHIRREFLKLQTIKTQAALGKRWVAKIDMLYHLNNLRLGNGGQDFDKYDLELREAIKEFERQMKSNANRVGLHVDAKRLFKNISADWEGLARFVEMPEMPMDNNESERVLRNPVVGRKNYYGSGSLWSAHLAAELFSIFATLKMHDVSVVDWLKNYLKAVAVNGGAPPSDIEQFLPWNFQKAE